MRCRMKTPRSAWKAHRVLCWPLGAPAVLLAQLLVLPAQAGPDRLELPMQAVSRGQTPEVPVPQAGHEQEDHVTDDALVSPRLQATTSQIGPEFPAPSRPDQGMPPISPVEQILSDVNTSLNNTLQALQLLDPSGRILSAGQP